MCHYASVRCVVRRPSSRLGGLPLPAGRSGERPGLLSDHPAPNVNRVSPAAHPLIIG